MLSLQEQKTLRRIATEQLTSLSAGVAATSLAISYGIGRLSGRHVFYTPEHRAQAHRLMVSHDVPTQGLAPQAKRSDAAQYGGMSEKTGTRAVHAAEVAVKLMGGCVWGGQFVSAPPQAFLVAKVEDLREVECDVLCLVENWEAFCDLHRYSWIEWGSARVMAVFRGDNVYSQTSAKRVIAERLERVWAFVDFDPAGLGIASSVPAARLERLLLPPRVWLHASAKTAVGRGLYAAQESQWAPSLDQSTHPAIASVWSDLKTLCAGVTQERMIHCSATIGAQ